MSANKELTRSPERVRNQGEVFTPIDFAKSILNRWLTVSSLQPEEKFIDLQCGTGNLLIAVVQWKCGSGLSTEQALKTTLGVDIAHDNVLECRQNLLKTVHKEDDEHFQKIVEKTIIQGNSVERTITELYR